MVDQARDHRARLLELLRTLSFERRKVVLASGKESDFYIDCKRTALTAEGHVLVGRLLFERIRELAPAVPRRGRPDARRRPAGFSAWPLRELPRPGDAAATLHRAQGAQGARHRPVDRGPPTIPDGSRVAVLEDVVTTGGSAAQGHRALPRRGARGGRPASRWSTAMEGGREAIEAPGVPVDSLFTRSDFLG